MLGQELIFLQKDIRLFCRNPLLRKEVSPLRIDFHAHAFADPIAEKAVDHLIEYYSISTKHGGRLADLLRTQAEAGCDACVLLVAATKPQQVLPANNWILGINSLTREELVAQTGVATPPRLIPFGTIHPDFPDWEAELVRLRAAGIRGLKLHPEFQGFALDDPRLFPIFEFMGGEMILLTHVGDRTVTPDNLSTPARVLNIRRNFPRLPIVAAHMGGYRMWNEALELLGGKDIYLDISSTMAFIDPALLRRFFSCHGVEHILFGSDYPLFSPGEELTKLERLLPDLSTYDRQRLLGENARELLKLAE